MPPFSVPCVCVWLKVRESYANGLCVVCCQLKVFRVTSRSLHPWNCDRLDSRPHICVRSGSPGQGKINCRLFFFLFTLVPTSSMFTHLHFYRRGLEVENTWLLSLSLVFTEAFFFVIFQIVLCLYMTSASPPSLWVLWNLFSNVSMAAFVVFFLTGTSLSWLGNGEKRSRAQCLSETSGDKPLIIPGSL